METIKDFIVGAIIDFAMLWEWIASIYIPVMLG